MRWPHRRTVAATVALPAVLVAVACSGKELATRWVPEDSAIVRCTTAGRFRMSPVLLDLPIPRVPTGLLARQLDPMALNDMGYERDQPVCAALLTPSVESVEQAPEALTALLDTYRSVGAEVKTTLGRCACDVAREADVAELVAPCRDEPHRPSCSADPEAIVRAQELVVPLRDALAATAVPRVHWRLAGRSDRPGWIVDRITELLPRHAGGATVFLAGQAIPSRHNHRLIRRLLEVPGARAVLRLDGGRAVLVIRELDDALVLDLLAFTAVAPDLVPLLPYLDDARADALAERLARPTSAWSPELGLDKGNRVIIDRTALATVDRMILAAAAIAGARETPTRLPEPETPALVAKATLLAPFGHKGERLTIELELTDEGKQWAQTLSPQPLAAQLEDLGFALRPEDEAPKRPVELELPAGLKLPFVGHGQPVERVVLDGLTGSAALFHRLEMHHPGSVAGTLDAWEVTLPPGAVAPGGTVPPPIELRQWTERVAEKSHRVRASFDAPRHHFTIEIEPD